MIEIPDVDIEVINRDSVAELFSNAISASQIANDQLVKHISGLYLQSIPVNPINGFAAFPYHEAEDLGYYKIDLLSCPNPYDGIGSMDELHALMEAPVDWNWFRDVGFVSTLFHLNGVVYEGVTMADVVAAYAPQSIMDLAILVAVKLPGKKHLIGEDWAMLREQIWVKEKDRGRQFKKSHSLAYSLVVALDAKRKASAYFNGL